MSEKAEHDVAECFLRDVADLWRKVPDRQGQRKLERGILVVLDRLDAARGEIDALRADRDAALAAARAEERERCIADIEAEIMEWVGSHYTTVRGGLASALSRIIQRGGVVSDD